MSEPGHTAEKDAPCPHCGGDETHVSYEDPTAHYCRACSRYFRVTPPGSSEHA